jgi:pyrroloquinoline quinone biosynthesis protein E
MSGILARSPAAPWVLIAELTHRCPLRCAYCSNPRQLVNPGQELSAEDWERVFTEARALGVLQLHLTGGEPLLRADLERLCAVAGSAGLFVTLVTSGLGGKRHPALARLSAIASAGVRAVQVSFQDPDGACAEQVAGRNAHTEKLAFAREVVARGMSLTVNVVLHRQNIDRVSEVVELGLALGADRLELAHVQYHGWAEENRAALLPDRAQVERASELVRSLRPRLAARIDLVHVMPDHFSGRPKPCMGGWGQRALVVDPAGFVLPCHGARALPLEHERIGQRSLAQIWQGGAAFEAFRGEHWMEEPCRSCPERERDFGGCRCQALAFSGRASATDPACDRSPLHERLLALTAGRQRAAPGAPAGYRLRQYQARPLTHEAK